MNLKQKKHKLCENIFLSICGLNIAFQYLVNISMFKITWSVNTFEYLVALLLVALVLRLITVEDCSIGNLIICSIVIVICYLEWCVNGGPEVLYFAIFVVGMQGIKSEKIIKVFLILSVFLLGVTVLAAGLGKVENLVYYRGENIRIAFGTVYPTIFSSQLLYLYMCYIYLKRKKLKNYDFLLGIILSAGMFFLCGARMSTGSMLFFVFGIIVIKYYSNVNKTLKIFKLAEMCALCSPALCCIGILTMTILFNGQNRILGIVNNVVSGRLLFAKEGLRLYGITKWGINFPQIGSGGTTQSVQNYFYIDSAYISYLLRYGVLILLLLIVVMLMLNYRVCAEKEWVLLWILTIIALHGIIEDRLLAPATNPFLWLVLANIQISDREEKGDISIE